jgi:hypothetical protein
MRLHEGVAWIEAAAFELNPIYSVTYERIDAGFKHLDKHHNGGSRDSASAPCERRIRRASPDQQADLSPPHLPSQPSDSIAPASAEDAVTVLW